MTLAEQIVACAVSHLGIRETARNRGPLIDTWVERIGLDPAGAHPWCAAFAWNMIEDACALLGRKGQLRRSGKVARLWSKNLAFQQDKPVRGAVYCHVVDPADHLSAGHCGIVESFDGEFVTGIEGNTNDDGSREGTMVRRQLRNLGWVNLGYLVVPE